MRHTIRLVALVVLLLPLGISAYSFNRVDDPRLSLYDVQHYDLSMGFDFLERTFSGKVVVSSKSLRPIKEFALSAASQTLTIDSILYMDRKLPFVQSPDVVVVDLAVPIRENQLFSFTLHFHGTAKFRGQLETGGAFIEIVKGLGRVVTSSEPSFAHTWWPCKDLPNDKATVAVNISTPSNLMGISNGSLKSTDRLPGINVYHWSSKYPISTYLVSVVVGDYRVFNNTYIGVNGQRMKIYYYVFPEDLSKAKTDFEDTPDILKFFASEFGEYPFIDEKFGFVEVAWGNTMENQTICSIEDRMITGDKEYENTFVHEIAHHWWGNLITPENWIHSWLNEGFATYAEALYQEHVRGKVGYRQYISNLMNVKNGHYNGSVIGQTDTSYWDAFSTRVYNKGGLILHMLRGVMGDEKFFQAMKSYVQNPRLRYGNAETKDFIAECEKAYGGSLDWFFKEWVYAYTPSIDRPEYAYTWSSSAAGSNYTVNLSIQQKSASSLLYKMPLQIAISSDKTTSNFTVFDSLAAQNFTLELPDKPKRIEIDNDNWVFKMLEFSRGN